MAFDFERRTRAEAPRYFQTADEPFAPLDPLARINHHHLVVMLSDAESTLRGPAPGRRVFGRYTLVRVIGQGGMGVVWLAHDGELGIDVALKFVADHLRWDQRVLTGLRREVLRARALSHPGIVRIHDLVSDASGAAIAMEYVAGGSLADRLAARLAEEPPRALEVADLAPLLPPLAAALDYAHSEAGVVHRDLKPSNILLTPEGLPKIADFGVARSLAESATRTSGVQNSGTLAYMGPQQLHDEPPTPADDIYALGATLYDLLAGSPPFRQGDVAGQIERKTPERIAVRRTVSGISGHQISAAWELEIAACLAKDPTRRPVSATEFAARLLDPVTRPQGSWMGRALRVWRGGRGRIVAAVLSSAAILAAWHYWPRLAPRPTPVAGSNPSDATRALAAWNLDGDGLDASGRGLHAIVQRALPTTDRFGRIDRALQFNGSAALVVPDSPLLRWSDSQPFSIALWVRSSTDSGEAEPLVASVPSEIGDLAWSIELRFSSPRFVLGNFGREGGVVLDEGAALSRGKWHHLAVVNDGGEVRLVVDGRLAARGRLGSKREMSTPKSVQLRFGSDLTSSRAMFAGELDDARLWRRVLAMEEIVNLASVEPPPRFIVSRGIFSDRDELATGLLAELGDAAALADWDEVRRWHDDDVRSWATELGLVVGGPELFVQRGGKQLYDETRRYFISRFDGTVPEYYGVHDELGGRTLVLGSWRGNQLRALVRQRPAIPRREKIELQASGGVTREFSNRDDVGVWSATWRLEVRRGHADVETRAEVWLHDGRVFAAVCAMAGGGKFAVAIGENIQPNVSREVSGSAGVHELTLVAKDGQLSFRGKKVVGGATLFAETCTIAEFKPRDVAKVTITGVDAAEFVVE